MPPMSTDWYWYSYLKSICISLSSFEHNCKWMIHMPNIYNWSCWTKQDPETMMEYSVLAMNYFYRVTWAQYSQTMKEVIRNRYNHLRSYHQALSRVAVPDHFYIGIFGGSTAKRGMAVEFHFLSLSVIGKKLPTTGEVHIWVKECLDLPLLRGSHLNSFVKWYQHW